MNKNIKVKDKKRTNSGKKAKGIKAESSASLSVTAVEHKRRGKPAKHEPFGGGPEAESGANEPGLAAAPSALEAG